MKWIKTEDNLPKLEYSRSFMANCSEEVLIVSRGIVIGGHFYLENVGFVSHDGYGDLLDPIDKVTHWMELPKSPYEI